MRLLFFSKKKKKKKKKNEEQEKVAATYLLTEIYRKKWEVSTFLIQKFLHWQEIVNVN